MALSHSLENDGALISRADASLEIFLSYVEFGVIGRPYFGVDYPVPGTKDKVLVTDREISEYHAKLTFDPDASGQFVEIGPGLGAVMSHLALRAQKGEIPPPIAIDTADFVGIREMLAYALTCEPVLEKISAVTRQRAEVLIGRCNLLLESPHVRFYNMTLGAALARHPELTQSADHLIEVYGPTFYPSVEGKKRVEVRDAAWALLKSDGIYHGHYSQ